MTIPATVGLVTLGVRDVPVATAFYAALGFPLSSASVEGSVSFFRTTGAVLAVWDVEELREDAAIPPDAGTSFRSVSLAINVGSPAEVDAHLAAAVEAGGTISRAATPTSWGGYNGYFADPDGYLWEIAHNPEWPIDERGVAQPPV